MYILGETVTPSLNRFLNYSISLDFLKIIITSNFIFHIIDVILVNDDYPYLFRWHNSIKITFLKCQINLDTLITLNVSWQTKKEKEKEKVLVGKFLSHIFKYIKKMKT